jgi:hypothetical protein
MYATTRRAVELSLRARASWKTLDHRSKTFDKIPHNLLLNKLERFGIGAWVSPCMVLKLPY